MSKQKQKPKSKETTPARDAKRSQPELAAFFGVNPRTIARWGDEGCPVKGRGPYDLFSVVEWWAKRIVAPKLLVAEKKAIKEDYDDASIDSSLKRRQKELQVLSAELDHAERTGELLPRQGIEQFLGELSVELRKAGEQLQKAYGDDAQEILHDVIERIKRKELNDRKRPKR